VNKDYNKSDLQTHLSWAIMSFDSLYDFLFVFHYNYVSILHRFGKFNDVTWPWQRPCKGQL